MLAVSLRLAEVAMKTLHKEQLTVGDFYGAWLSGSMDTSKILSPLAKALVQSMNKRERQLLDTDVFCAAVYIDPRYRLLLTSEQKYRATLHLTKTWRRITALQCEQDSILSSETAAVPEDPADALEALLTEREVEAGVLVRVTSSPFDISCLLEMLDKKPRLSRDANMLQFWEERRERHPEL
ncbi:hypothetical protein ANAPC5_01459 [Anaplasma phagocytophilum]|nr:hypothetical protein ANAPC5_01459 [Anaplasma phagocytophilum]